MSIDKYISYLTSAENLGSRLSYQRVPEGFESYALATLLRALDQVRDSHSAHRDLIHIVRDDKSLQACSEAIKLFGPDLDLLEIPAWDCVPYDRSSPKPDLVANRITALAKLVKGKRKAPRLILTTARAIVQKFPPKNYIANNITILSPGKNVDRARFLSRLNTIGYHRTETVMERGEYAVRGSIIDIFLSGYQNPVRLDFFGDQLETIRQFDVGDQRTKSKINRATLLPISEFPFDEKAQSLFRKKYAAQFGAAKPNDSLYEAISHGQYYQGMEHWLPFFHDDLDSLFSYVPEAIISFDYEVMDAIESLFDQIDEHYHARLQGEEQATFGAPPYLPVPIEEAFLTHKSLDLILRKRHSISFSPFDVARPEIAHSKEIEQTLFQGKLGRKFTTERVQEDVSLFDEVINYITNKKQQGKIVILTGWSDGATERLKHLLEEAGLTGAVKLDTWQEVLSLSSGQVPFITLGLEAGFETADFCFINEQDILGDRLVRPRKKQKSDAQVLKEATSLMIGDHVVHSDHGIGRFEGLRTVEAVGAPHDCLELLYHGGDKLFLPVENIDLLTRYGSEGATPILDRLGGSAWQARKAKIKKRVRDIAEKLIQIAALRELKTAPVLNVPDDLYEEFCARFAFEETPDQDSAIEAVIDDLAKGRPSDRLICGDVGFGKTEVALRASFIAAMSGKQVAIIAPTTLLARQHYKTFCERFKGMPVKIGHASRLVGAKQLKLVKDSASRGDMDIVIGTHALLGKTINFADLGLLIIDEEQHFGVQHKERLKSLKEDVHVLTLSATPIPRTLQMSLSGVRDLSLITTPPIDRLAIRTYVSPFDPMIIREALLRERFRGGQSFFVCPRIKDLGEAMELLSTHVPELKVIQAHGQMPPGELEDIMNAFYDRKFDVLLSTTIVESGLDIPTANTLVVYRADRFGLSQLYQLRGRVGRSKIRAYAYMTLASNKKITPAAEKRLKILASLDQLGAGFTLASHDLDMRGAGNLVGEEQSGHIKEIGFELYQTMLEEAVASLKGGGIDEEEKWSPTISLGTPVVIPENYVQDLQLRLSLYRRLSKVSSSQEIDEIAAELIDRFGPYPDQVRQLLAIVDIKRLCRLAGIEKIEAGEKGAQISFRGDTFSNLEGLIELVNMHSKEMRFGADHKLNFRQNWKQQDERLSGVKEFIKKLVQLVNKDHVAA